MEANPQNLELIFDPSIAYRIPLFQRPYVWNEEENWQPLWDDIQLLMDRYLLDKKVHSHFLGAVVLEQVTNATGSIGARQVIDGQQRLTTLQLFLLAARDLCNELGAEKYFECFTDLTANKKSRIVQETERYKVWPTNSDRDAFIRTHCAGSPAKVLAEFPNKKSVSRTGKMIPDAYLYFSEQLRNWLAGDLSDEELSDKTQDDYLETLWNVIKAHLQLVVIDIDKDDESQVIFETLNARGTQLLPGDLIKNYLFHKAEGAEKEIQRLYDSYWHDFDDPDSDFWREEVRQGRVKRPRIDLFMQHYLTLHTQDDIRVAHIFNAFKFYAERYELREGDERVLPNSPDEHLKALCDYGKVFRTFYKREKNSRLEVFLSRLEAVDTATVYPFLLEASYTLSKNHAAEFERILHWLESYLVRRMICCLTTKNYNRLFIEMIKAVQAGGRITEQKVVDFLLKSDADTARFPDDEEFTRAWLMNPSYNNLAQFKTRAILVALNSAFETSKSEVISLPTGLTIEHVLPKNWEAHWPLELDEPTDVEKKLLATNSRNEILDSFGNLTLITNSLNPALSNGAWEDKKPELIKFSKLNLTRYFCDCDHWDENAISKRGKVLLKKAKAIWAYPAVAGGE